MFKLARVVERDPDIDVRYCAGSTATATIRTADAAAAAAHSNDLGSVFTNKVVSPRVDISTTARLPPKMLVSKPPSPPNSPASGPVPKNAAPGG